MGKQAPSAPVFIHMPTQEMGNMHQKSILNAIYRYSQIFDQNIQYTYTLRILENIECTIYFCFKKYIQYTFRIYFKNY